MKTYINAIIIFVLCLFAGCNDQAVTPPSGQTGTVSLAFEDSPAGITQVIARLTRQGYEDRLLALTIADSGAGASGTMNNVAVGTWHLKVDAIDGSGNIQYTGEADVEVQPGTTSYVALELVQTTGSIHIVVTWGSPCVHAPSGLVSWWRGENNADDAREENNGVLMNGATFANGKVGKALSFDGVDDYVRVANSSSLNVTGSLTIEVWIYPTTDQKGTIMAKWGDTGDWSGQQSYAFNFWIGRRLDFSISDSLHQYDAAFQILRTDEGTVPLNQWSHVAAVYDQRTGTRYLYINGIQQTLRTQLPFTVFQGIADVSIGGFIASTHSGVQSPFPGKIDELAFFTRALSEEEIKSIYNAGSIGKCPPPPPLVCVPVPSSIVSWWRAEDNADDAVDGNDGILMNGATYANGKVGKAFSFDGVDDYVRIPSSSNLNPTGSFSIDAWIYPTQNIDGGIVSQWGDFGEWDDQRAIQVDMISGQKLRFAISDSAHQDDPAFHVFDTDEGVIVLNQWNHVTAVYHQPLGKRLVYVNGNKVAERTDLPIHITPSIADLTIGGVLPHPTMLVGLFHGSIDEVDFYTKVLTASEIRSIYLAGIVGKCPPPPPQCVPVPSGIVSWWRSDESASDEYGRNSGTLMNGATYTSGKVGQAFNFDGVDDHVRIPSSSSLNPTGSFTIDAWIYPVADVPHGSIIGKWGFREWSNQRSWSFGIMGGGGIEFALSDSAHQEDPSFHAFFTGSGVVKMNQWNHVAAVFDKSTYTRKIYVNGFKVAERTDLPFTLTQSIADVTIGIFKGSPSFFDFPFPGRIDEVDFFNKALTGTEIRNIYLAGSIGKCK